MFAMAIKPVMDPAWGGSEFAGTGGSGVENVAGRVWHVVGRVMQRCYGSSYSEMLRVERYRNAEGRVRKAAGRVMNAAGSQECCRQNQECCGSRQE